MGRWWLSTGCASNRWWSMPPTHTSAAGWGLPTKSVTVSRRDNDGGTGRPLMCDRHCSKRAQMASDQGSERGSSRCRMPLPRCPEPILSWNTTIRRRHPCWRTDRIRRGGVLWEPHLSTPTASQPATLARHGGGLMAGCLTVSGRILGCVRRKRAGARYRPTRRCAFRNG